MEYLAESHCRCFYKYFYPAWILHGKRKAGGNKGNSQQIATGNRTGRDWTGKIGLQRARDPSNPCQSCFPHAPAEYSAVNRAHHHLSGVRRPTEHLPPHRHYCTIPDAAAGGALGSKGSCDLQRSLAQCRRIRSTTRGSVIKETMRMRPPQLHRRGSASKIFFINRAHVLRASLELSELSRSESIAAGEPALSPSAGVAEIRARLE